jgi:hypothetical protein
VISRRIASRLAKLETRFGAAQADGSDTVKQMALAAMSLKELKLLEQAVGWDQAGDGGSLTPEHHAAVGRWNEAYKSALAECGPRMRIEDFDELASRD